MIQVLCDHCGAVMNDGAAITINDEGKSTLIHFCSKCKGAFLNGLAKYASNWRAQNEKDHSVD
jgi:hypothetical protein